MIHIMAGPAVDPYTLRLVINEQESAMLKKVTGLFVLSALLAMPVSILAEEAVYGHELMTDEELRLHREKMHSFKTDQEREDYRAAHHEAMQKRAEERGVTIPEEPMERGKGMHRGPQEGMGPGMGQGR